MHYSIENIIILNEAVILSSSYSSCISPNIITYAFDLAN